MCPKVTIRLYQKGPIRLKLAERLKLICQGTLSPLSAIDFFHISLIHTLALCRSLDLRSTDMVPD